MKNDTKILEYTEAEPRSTTLFEYVEEDYGISKCNICEKYFCCKNENKCSLCQNDELRVPKLTISKFRSIQRGQTKKEALA